MQVRIAKTVQESQYEPFTVEIVAESEVKPNTDEADDFINDLIDQVDTVIADRLESLDG